MRHLTVAVLIFAGACGGSGGASPDMTARCQTVVVAGLAPGAPLDCPCAQPTGECTQPLSCVYTIEMYGPPYPQCDCECGPSDGGGMRWTCAC